MTQASLGTFNATKNHEAKIIAWISYRYPMLVGIALGVFPPRESGNIDPIARLVSFFKGFFSFLAEPNSSMLPIRIFQGMEMKKPKRVQPTSNG